MVDAAMRRTNRKWKYALGVACSAFIGGACLHLEFSNPGHSNIRKASLPISHSRLRHSQTDLTSIGSSSGTVNRVLVIGSSVAQGWRDSKADGGYINRAFRAISDVSNNNFDVYDNAIPGKGVESIVDTYASWLDTVKPDIVVVAWGGLDDLHGKTPLGEFDEQIKWEINLALAHHALVFVLTSPISRASYTTYKTAQPLLFDNEMSMADSFHNPNVYVFDVFDQMKQYLIDHNQTYEPYMSDGWHPNAAGHELAAQLLVSDWSQVFGSGVLKPFMSDNLSYPLNVKTHHDT
jgi:acyl-CoA thioesterase I